MKRFLEVAGVSFLLVMGAVSIGTNWRDVGGPMPNLTDVGGPMPNLTDVGKPMPNWADVGGPMPNIIHLA